MFVFIFVFVFVFLHLLGVVQNRNLRGAVDGDSGARSFEAKMSTNLFLSHIQSICLPRSRHICQLQCGMRMVLQGAPSQGGGNNFELLQRAPEQCECGGFLTIIITRPWPAGRARWIITIIIIIMTFHSEHLNNVSVVVGETAVLSCRVDGDARFEHNAIMMML